MELIYQIWGDKITYSIIAQCQQTGNFGIGVQSHWFASGVVCWAKAGVGAVATQAMALIDHGPLGLENMKAGESAFASLQNRLNSDETPEIRQVAMIDREGNVAVHTGSRTIPESGHIVGDGFSCQANMMWNGSVWESMYDNFSQSEGDLSRRILSSLYAAQSKGGDIRGMQSSRILIVSSDPKENPWEETILDLRVDDHSDPLSELERLHDLHDAYTSFEDTRLRNRNHVDVPELAFWKSIELANSGREDEARNLFKVASDHDDCWRELLIRCSKNELVGITKVTLETLLGDH